MGEEALSDGDLIGKRVVIAEDEAINRLYLRRLLSREGLDVVGEAANGKEAVEIVLQTRPELVLMDIDMPGTNGLEASEQILKNLDVCIVLLTGFSDGEREAQGKAIGTCGYLVKPFTGKIFFAQLAVFLQEFHRRA